MGEKFTIAVIGSGPAGLSAACHAAELGLSHVLLEAEPHLSHTIFRYQRGKHVMAEPSVLPLRSPLRFEAGKREIILDNWQEDATQSKTNIRHDAEVTAISGHANSFEIKLKNGETVQAENVVLGIGLQGNVRKLGAPGENLPFVQYQLDDPDAYHDETIIVVGAGDAAIENAIALTPHNRVYIVNRRDEFNRAQDRNNSSILASIESGKIECLYESTIERAEQGGDKPGQVTFNTPSGQTTIACDRVIARLGAIPPRRFVEQCGIEFPNDDPTAVPAVSTRYESNVPGLYIIGALAGYPLIKQAANQGYEVIEFICGNPIEPADEPLLREKFQHVPGFTTVDAMLDRLQDAVPVLAPLTKLQLREFLLDSELRTPKQGDPIFLLNDYTNTFFSIVEGSVDIEIDPDNPKLRVSLGAGKFFGEMSLISGRRRSATVIAGSQCLLVETPRRTMNKLINSVDAVRNVIDQAFLMRAIQTQIAPSASTEALLPVVESAQTRHYKANEILFREGEQGDSLHLIRSGSVTISQQFGDKDMVLAYVAAGNYVGEMALLSGRPRAQTVRAAVATETILLEATPFMAMLEQHPKVRADLDAVFRERLTRNLAMEQQPEQGQLISFLMAQGIGEATDALLIDESLCIRCDQCEKACASTHGNVSRLDREAGPSFANVHVPTSCRHCEHPHCMKDCPPDAIRRATNGEVFILDSCIGCGNCETNCPYGVIQMGVATEEKPSLWQWLFLGRGPEPGSDLSAQQAGKPGSSKKAVKCDMCKDRNAGPACVQACPTGAAIRVTPEEFVSFLTEQHRHA